MKLSGAGGSNHACAKFDFFVSRESPSHLFPVDGKEATGDGGDGGLHMTEGEETRKAKQQERKIPGDPAKIDGKIEKKKDFRNEEEKKKIC